ncbi:MAG: Ig domain-containing protein [Mangrovibacterium sp.]
MKKLIKTRLVLLLICTIFSPMLISCGKDEDHGTDEVTSIEFIEPEITLVSGGKAKLFLLIENAEADISDTTWNSSDTKIATVGDEGIVTAQAAGEAVITAFVGNIKAQCMLTVIDSPIKDLVMPDIRYPIAQGSLVFLKGKGFSSSNRIWLRRINISGISLKSAAGDIPVTINNVTDGHISFLCDADPPGWYAIELEGEKFRFGLGYCNVQKISSAVCEYAYDKNKIFWDDTHWRWFQLRGRVKEMRIEATYGGEFLYRFNEKGYLVSCLCSRGDSTSHTYDASNRITSFIYYQGSNSLCKGLYGPTLMDRYEYSYGNYDKYYRLQRNSQGGIGFLNYLEDDENPFSSFIFVKGLTGINRTFIDYANNLAYNSYYDIHVYSDSIRTIGPTGFYPTIIRFGNSPFPYEEVTEEHRDGVEPIRSVFKFTLNGMPDWQSTVIDEFAYHTVRIDQFEFVKDSPFCLFLMVDVGSEHVYGKKHVTFRYDQNSNMIEIDDDRFNESSTYDYISYDSKGNWTECIAVNKRTYRARDNLITRDFTYWE